MCSALLSSLGQCLDSWRVESRMSQFSSSQFLSQIEPQTKLKSDRRFLSNLQIVSGTPRKADMHDRCGESARLLSFASWRSAINILLAQIFMLMWPFCWSFLAKRQLGTWCVRAALLVWIKTQKHNGIDLYLRAHWPGGLVVTFLASSNCAAVCYVRVNTSTLCRHFKYG